MMKNISKNRVVVLFILFLNIFMLGSCEKFLAAKNDKDLAEPTTIVDLQALIDYFARINNFSVGAGLLAGDEYYLSDADFKALPTEQNRNMYLWNDNNVVEPGFNTWSFSFDRIYTANTVLEKLPNIAREKDNAEIWDNLKGQALLLRGKSFFEVAIVWSLAYDPMEAEKDLGLPLRLSTDFNERSVRSSLKATYAQIVNDIKRSIDLLPTKPIHDFRGSEPAACALLARVYLSMREYDSCYRYSDLAMKLDGTLLDYNSLDTNKAYPFERFGPEVILDNGMLVSYSPLSRVDSVLFRMYAPGDLRKVLLFNPNADGSHSFGGTYGGSSSLFCGVATDEVYLMHAECLARKGEIQQALADLNTLLKLRYKTGTFSPLTTADSDEALKWILAERRKELLYRGLRWMDIKRLNKEGANIILKRIIDGKSIVLPPNDPRYALAIPDDVIDISGMPQNPR
ncbi:MAG TPA: RagB/SusD family nutrient uptake outer membrane protein [Arachidicoccus sp.]|nr:RagB/SusD family nutrient uptake outer membrane protein [Arachidicoccus sp.]